MAVIVHFSWASTSLFHVAIATVVFRKCINFAERDSMHTDAAKGRWQVSGMFSSFIFALCGIRQESLKLAAET